ncbi:plastocyanin/azurin family copper-binding protein [Halosimplex amylolyticum]|uniref:plastocyanin/azurin family copper-binding protein n=1 Tax=Halosimplex amylolyticum TaxID=3396616 RepID=UPI003F564389
MDRRQLLRTGAAALAAALAGCGDGDGTATEEPPADGGGGDSTPSPTTAPAGGGGTTAPPDETSRPESTPTASATPTGTSETTPTATAAPTASPTSTAATTSTATPRQAAQVVAVADGALAFDPESFEISTGETVVWVWHSSGHNVRPESTPSGSDFSGTAGGDDDLYDEGHTLSHTFEVAGEYEYYCNPHRSVGMTGSFTVAE